MDKTLDTRGMRCPIPILKARKVLNSLDKGQILEVFATDGQTPRDFKDFCAENNHILRVSETTQDGYRFLIEK